MTDPLTPEERAELRTLANEAPPGPWVVEEERFMRCVVLVVNAADGQEVVSDAPPHPLHYIAAASPDKIEALLDQVEAQAAELATLRPIVNDLANVTLTIGVGCSVCDGGIWTETETGNGVIFHHRDDCVWKRAKALEGEA